MHADIPFEKTIFMINMKTFKTSFEDVIGENVLLNESKSF